MLVTSVVVIDMYFRTSDYDNLRRTSEQMHPKDSAFIVLKHTNSCIKFVRFYSSDITTVQMTLSLSNTLTPMIRVHNILLDPSHCFFQNLPSIKSYADVQLYL